MTATLTIYRTRSLRRSQRWGWRLTAANGRNVAASGEGYTDRAEALWQALQVIGGHYSDAVVAGA